MKRDQKRKGAHKYFGGDTAAQFVATGGAQPMWGVLKTPLLVSVITAATATAPSSPPSPPPSPPPPSPPPSPPPPSPPPSPPPPSPPPPSPSPPPPSPSPPPPSPSPPPPPPPSPPPPPAQPPHVPGWGKSAYESISGFTVSRQPPVPKGLPGSATHTGAPDCSSPNNYTGCVPVPRFVEARHSGPNRAGFLPPSCTSSDAVGCVRHPITSRKKSDVESGDEVANNVDFVAKTVAGLTDDSSTASGITWAAAACDLDDDGDLDLVVVNNGANQLYFNMGNWNFQKDVSTEFHLTNGTSYAVACADYNDDGYLDVVVGNDGQNELFTNDGSGFNKGALTSDTSTPITNTSGKTRTLAWGDYNGDNLVDLLVGNDGDANELYLNLGGGAFSSVAGTPMTALDTSAMGTWSVVWADMDNDGDLDIVMGNKAPHGGGGEGGEGGGEGGEEGGDRRLDEDGGGGGNFTGINYIFRNDGGGNFTKLDSTAFSATVVQVWTIAVADMDGDGLLDIFVGSQGTDEIFHNDGNLQFTKVTGSPAAQDAQTWAVAFFDHDLDGDLDLALGADASNTFLSNDGAGNYVLTPNALTTESKLTTCIIAADFNNDGLLDAFVCNQKGQSVGEANEIYENTGGGAFVRVTSSPLLDGMAFSTGKVAWSDFDHDGDLDVVFAYYSTGSSQTRHALNFFRNLGDGNFEEILDTPIGGTNLVGRANDNFVNMEWADYNMDGWDDLIVVAKLENGWTDMPGDYIARGYGTDGHQLLIYRNEQNGNFTLIDLLTIGIDLLYDGGGLYWDLFADAPCYDADPSLNSCTPTKFQRTIPMVAAKFGDYNNDGCPDLAVKSVGTSTNFGQSNNRLYRSNCDGSGNFTAVTDTVFTAHTGKPDVILKWSVESLMWVDFDGDGWLDLLEVSAGFVDPALQDPLFFYRNNQNGTFTRIENDVSRFPSEAGTRYGITFLDDAPGSASSPAEWEAFAFADYDKDGLIDLAVGFEERGFLFHNDGEGNFSLVSEADFPLRGQVGTQDIGVAYSLAWLDADGDGDLDLLAAGPTVLYENQGDGTFVSTTTAMSQGSVEATLISVVDIDMDGDMDVFLLEETNNVNELYVYEHCPSNTRLGLSHACIETPTNARRGPYTDIAFECSPHFTGATVRTQCASCPPGFDRGVRVQQCEKCELGYATLGEGVPCTACALGFVATINGSAVCFPCAAGSYAGQRASSACATAQIGFYAGLGASEQTPCAPGRFGDAPGRPDDQCSGACARGHYCPAGSTVATAEKCPAGTYMQNEGARSEQDCIPCPTGSYCPIASETPTPCEDELPTSTTLAVGAKTFEECQCPVGSYLKDSGEVPECVTCPEGMDCTALGDSVENIKLNAGFWRQTALSTTVRKCRFTGVQCVGGRIREDNTTRRQLSEVNAALIAEADVLCATGNEGPYCMLCADGYYGGDQGTVCTLCEGSPELALIAPIAIVAVIIGFIFCGCIWFRRDPDGFMKSMNTAGALAGESSKKGMNAAAALKVAKEQTKKKAIAAGKKADTNTCCGMIKFCLAQLMGFLSEFGVKLKILISLYQVMGGVSQNFDIPFPPIFASTNSFISAQLGKLNIDLPSMMPIDCLVRTSFLTEMLVSTLVPLAIMTALGITSLLAKGNLNPRNWFRKGTAQGISPAHAWVGESAFTINFFIMFIVYPSASKTIFSFFDCETFTGDGETPMRLLRVDPSVNCESAEYQNMYVIALILVILYPIGIPLFFAYTLRGAKDALEMLKHEELLLFGNADTEMNSGMQLAKPSNQALKEACTTQPDGVSPVQTVKELKATHAKKRAQALAQMEKLKQKHLSPTIRKLCSGYEMRVYWFELFECARKISLVAVPIFLKDFPAMQMTLGLILCFITFGSYTSFAPFIQDDDDFLQVMAQISIFFTLLSSIVLKAHPDSQPMALLLVIMLLVAPAISLSNQLKKVFKSIFKPLINSVSIVLPTRKAKSQDVSESETTTDALVIETPVSIFDA